MNLAVILSGGTGSRMGGGDVPKQYMEVEKKPVIGYCLETFQKHPGVDGILIVADVEWRSMLTEWVKGAEIDKFLDFANPGRTRQHSIYNGIKKAWEHAREEDIVIIHDAARPCVSAEVISGCIMGAAEADGAMPVLPVKDTVYQSEDGGTISGLLNRDTLFCGQAPESFRLGKYLAAHERLTESEIGAVRGSSEIAFLAGMEIKMIEGSEDNFKITTPEDMKRFRSLILERMG